MIVATAGHVDHGKTSLIRALTGIETDTLAEEIERGLSINLGYAYLSQASDHTLGFIDVPGHRRFINTMISGISGVDMGLLVVAADDGPMPQTLEHIDVLDILGVESLCVVINKVDRVDASRVSDVLQQVEALIKTRRWPEHESFARIEPFGPWGGGAEKAFNHRRSDPPKTTQYRRLSSLYRPKLQH